MAKNKIEIPKLILDHLLQYGNTSILGLGTLFYDHHTAYLSDDKSLIYPPGNTLLFRDSTDDTDQFTAYVANQLGISQKKALAKVDKFAQYIINNLLNYGKAEIPSIGHFVKDDEQDIKFIQNQGEVNSEYFGLLPLKLEPIQFYKEGEMAGAAMAVSTESIPHRAATISTIAAKATASTQPSYNYNDDDDDSSWLKPLLWIFGLILLSALTYKGCETLKSNQNKLSPTATIDSMTVENRQDGEVISGENSNGEELIEKVDEEIVETTPEVNKITECVIILGAYESARNAMKMSTKVSQLGYTPYEEYFDTMDVTRVGFKFDCSDKDLRDFILKVRKDIAQDAWYLVPRITVE